jgi:glycogenin glucosyltransferase
MFELERPVNPAAVPDPDDRAFVVFLMFNDSYLPGALTAAYGLVRQGSPSRRTCVVTPEISDEARQTLAALFHDVIEVEPIAVPAIVDSTSSGQIRTGSARVLSAALTRFASLRLGPDGDLGTAFKKVTVIDADLLPLRDFDDLWLLPAPAGIINEHRSHMAEIDPSGKLIIRPESVHTGRGIWHEIYGSTSPHGAPIPKEVTDRVAVDTDNYGVNASLVVIEPSFEVYDDLMRWVAQPDIGDLARNRWPWIDQQAATLYWSGQWTNVDVSFSTLYGYPSLEAARGLHFAGIKPWSWRKNGFERRLHRFPDYYLWANVFLEMLEEVSGLRNRPKLGRLGRELEAGLLSASQTGLKL